MTPLSDGEHAHGAEVMLWSLLLMSSRTFPETSPNRETRRNECDGDGYKQQ